MAKAKEAQQWAKEEFKGIMESLYTPWTKDGEVDEEAMRKEVRRVLVDLKSEGVWYCSAVGEGFSMTMGEKKKVAEIVIGEARKVKPKAVVVGGINADSAKDAVELINYSAELGADIVVICTPRFLYGEEGILGWFGYVAEHTDIALSIWQHGPWILIPGMLAKMAEKWPAFCAIKNVSRGIEHSAAVTALSKGRIQVYPGELTPYVFWDTILRGDLGEAARKYYDYRIFHLQEFFQQYSQYGHGFPGVKQHRATLEKYWAAQLGMPMGTGGWQTYRAGGATTLPKEVQDKCRSLLIEAGLIKD